MPPFSNSVRFLRISSISNIPLRRPLTRSIPRSPLQHPTKRNASYTTQAGPLGGRVSNFLRGTVYLATAGLLYLSITDTRSFLHQYAAVPLIRYLFPDAEDAHHFGTAALKALYSFGLHPRERSTYLSATEEVGGKSIPDLSVEVFGERLVGPIGTSAGIDKLAEVPGALFAIGSAIVEVGGCTPRAQPGNPKPRMFRLPEQNALINRYGLNSLGADDMARRLRERVRLFAKKEGYGVGPEGERIVLNGEADVPPGSLQRGKLLAVQVAKNKDTPDSDIDAVRADYVYCVERLAPYADILVVNVSSPNTPGLRSLQATEPLAHILGGVVDAARSVKRSKAQGPKVMVKVSPDEDSDEQIEGIVEAVWRSGVDGVIVGNTTNRRTLPPTSVVSTKEKEILKEIGGLSGPHMFERTRDLVKKYRKLLDQGPPQSEGDLTGKVVSAVTGKKQDQKVIFATGGVTNGKQALEILNAGASVAQIYTALIYGGVGTVTRIKREMREEIRDGEKSLTRR